MGAAAQLHRPAHRVAGALAHGDDADFIAVFLAEQRARAYANGVVAAQEARHHRAVLQHHVVRNVLDAPDSSSAYRLRMRKVEAQTIGCNQRAFCAT